jgi:hypothetical protein
MLSLKAKSLLGGALGWALVFASSQPDYCERDFSDVTGGRRLLVRPLATQGR